eukprot:TRINITY_DN12005_c0_g1_i1.p1 TRINITY_DN12005_c0_g1~~TRINITY_DN12005_c0_g1_i1.p1  ORF type:complete len:113 (+),score=12.32 TRINITY_DN12005_c0_g1_i1:256-594(+)
MKADFEKYFFYYANPEIRSKSVQIAADSLNEAHEISLKHFVCTDPMRLEVELKYSVLLYDLLNEPNKAFDIAKTAFDSAIEKIEELDEDNYKDSTLLMQLLRDNLTLWNSDL